MVLASFRILGGFGYTLFFRGGRGGTLLDLQSIVKFVFLQPLLNHDLAIPHYLLAHAGVIDMGAELQIVD